MEDKIPHKDATFDELLAYALEKYKGNEERAMRFIRGWYSVGEKKQ